jgi:hypothetical protein
MEYTKWAQENPGKADQKPLVIVPAAIVYTNKSKYRSDVSCGGHKSISVLHWWPLTDIVLGDRRVSKNESNL